MTKNDILLIDMTNQHVREGMTVRQAILTAGPIRLRPILMTTMAMILGMLPSALGRGEGGEFRAPISIATIGGLITSTALTLVVVPVAYLLLHRLLERLKLWRDNPDTRLSVPVRVAGMLILMLLVGWFLSATTAFAQEGRRPRLQPGQLTLQDTAQLKVGSPIELSFDEAIAMALANNEGLKVTQEQVHKLARELYTRPQTLAQVGPAR